MNEKTPLPEALAALSQRLRAWTEAEARRQPGARARLARPLEAVAPAARPAPQAAAPAAASSERAAALLGLKPAAAGTAADPRPPFADSLDGFRAQIEACQRCGLGAKRKRLVFGDGDLKARLVLVGDAASHDDDATGKPFSGAAGELLDRILAAMGLKRGQVYLCTVLKCRVQGKQAPPPASLEACRPFLEHQLSLLSPAVIVAMGPVSASLLLGSEAPLERLRGRFGAWQGVPVMATYAPDALLADPGLKRHVWDDMKSVIQRLK